MNQYKVPAKVNGDDSDQVRAALEAVFVDLPDGATSYHTYYRDNLHLACFLVGKTGKFVDVAMTPKQVAALRQCGLLGWGWWL